MTILENFVWRGENDMKKTVLLIIPLLFLFVGCASLYNRSNYNNYKPILLKNIEIDNLLNKKWLLKYYIVSLNLSILSLDPKSIIFCCMVKIV